MKALRNIIVLLVAAAALAAGCVGLPTRPPETAGELDDHIRSGQQEFPTRTILMHNVRRVAAADLKADERLESLRVVERLDKPESPDLDAEAALAGVLGDAATPNRVRLGVLAFLAKRGYSGLTDYVASALPQTGDETVRAALLDWLETHPYSAKLADIVKLWASEKGTDEFMESRYRRLVQRMTGKNWDQALLQDGLNAVSFAARGSAMEVLANRVRPDQLRRQIMAVTARSKTMGALQYFSDGFGYLPKTRRELLVAVTLYTGSSQRLRLASELCEKWRAGGYRFNIRDYHLLSRLAADPLRRQLTGQQLASSISRGISARRGVFANRDDPAWRERIFRHGKLVDFDSQRESLSVADLWNLYLIDEMLGRARIRQGLALAAEKDRTDNRSQWGGLITYEQGQAEARLYEPAAKEGDDRFVPRPEMLGALSDSMCFFIGHFDRVYPNASQVEPSRRELEFARNNNIPGVIITSIAGEKLDVTYFTPEGVIVDLGEYPTGKK